MNLRHMEIFHAIMRTGSVTGAARVLNVSQPAVSAALKHCESQLKMKLFTRVSGRLQPTAEALAIFPEVAAIFGRVGAINLLTQDLVGGRLGTLSIAASFPIANGFLAKAVATFLADRPKVRVALVEPFLVDSMGLPGLVARPLKPRIEVETLLIRYKAAPHSKVMTQFINHLQRTVAAERANR